MRSELAKAAVLTLIALALMGTFYILPVFATPLSIHLDPPSIAYDTSNAPIGTLFNVTVITENVPATPSAFDPTIIGASAWQVYVEFNDSNIMVTRWYEPTTDPTYIFFGKTTSALPSPPNAGYFHVGPNLGRIQVASNLFPTPPAQNGSSGPGPFKLCILTINITKLPDHSSGPLSSALHFSPADTFLLDPDGNEIPTTFEDGHYQISEPIVPQTEYTLTIAATLEAQQIRPLEATYIIKGRMLRLKLSMALDTSLIPGG